MTTTNDVTFATREVSRVLFQMCDGSDCSVGFAKSQFPEDLFNSGQTRYFGSAPGDLEAVMLAEGACECRVEGPFDLRPTQPNRPAHLGFVVGSQILRPRKSAWQNIPMWNCVEDRKNTTCIFCF